MPECVCLIVEKETRNLILFLVGLFLAVPFWAFIEYVAHRWFMHGDGLTDPFTLRRQESHALHHGFGWQWTKVVHRHVDDGVSPAWNVVGSSVLWLPLAVWVSVPFAAAFILVAFLHGVCWTAVHHEFHSPRHPWWSWHPLFGFIRHNHEFHHKYPECNFAALFPPFMDILFGTRKV